MISLIATVKNEKANLADWLESLKQQTKQPDEIIIVDGGSTDGSWELLQAAAEKDKRLTVDQHPGNISTGRNRAISLAQSDIIAATDAGCRHDKDWLEKLTTPILSGSSTFATTAFRPWLKSEDNFLIYLVAAATIPATYEFNKDWLPSSRSVAFSKKIWQSVGGYPEWLPICEDVVFDLELKKAGNQAHFVRQPLVYWRPRPTISAYLRQLYQYTRSDGHAQLFLHRQLIRYGIYLTFVLAVLYSPLLLKLLAIGAIFYLKKFWLRWLAFTRKKNLLYRLVGFALVPIVVGLGDAAKMVGWPVGVWQRLTGKVVKPKSNK